MKIGIDARFLTRQPIRGIGSYSKGLIHALVDMQGPHTFYLYIQADDLAFDLPLGANVIVRQIKVPFYPLWEQVILPWYARRDNLDILHCLGNTGPVVMPKNVPLVLTLMDVMFLQPSDIVPVPTNLYQRIGRFYRRLVAPRCARIAERVITITESSKADILEYIPGLESSKVTVAGLSCDDSYTKIALTKSDFKDLSDCPSYIFALGAEDPRKNTYRLLQGYFLAVEKYHIQENLIICGFSNWRNSNCSKLVRESKYRSKVTVLGYLTQKELVEMYRGAKFFIFPSLYEGFGIPLLEAFSVGCPVAASNVSSIPEVGGTAVFYFDPYDEVKICTAIVSLIDDSSRFEKMVADGYDRSRVFNWESIGLHMLAIYYDVIRHSK
jgi:glycosyltransferase involved in cell wall biosynthesis